MTGPSSVPEFSAEQMIAEFRGTTFPSQPLGAIMLHLAMCDGLERAARDGTVYSIASMSHKAYNEIGYITRLPASDPELPDKRLSAAVQLGRFTMSPTVAWWRGCVTLFDTEAETIRRVRFSAMKYRRGPERDVQFHVLQEPDHPYEYTVDRFESGSYPGPLYVPRTRAPAVTIDDLISDATNIVQHGELDADATLRCMSNEALAARKRDKPVRAMLTDYQ